MTAIQQSGLITPGHLVRAITVVLTVFYFVVAPACAQTGTGKTPAQLNAEVNSLWPDNTSGLITPFNARQTLLDIIASGVPCAPRTSGYSTNPVRACEFGAVGDATFNFNAVYPNGGPVAGLGGNAITGTDSTAAIQAAIDYALQNNFNTVCLNDGKYKTSKALQLGYGERLVSIVLQACGNGRVSYENAALAAGVGIYPTATNQCAINIQGGRDVAVRNIAISGQNWSFGSSVYTSSPIPTAASGWLDSNLIPTGSNSGGVLRFAPYGGVCIDPHYGAAPTTPYPNITYPAWLSCSPTCPQYSGPQATSNIELTDLDIEGFPIAVALQPNGDDNGDFLQISKMNCQFSVYCISIGNTQSRNVAIRDSNFNGVFTWLTTNINGSQNGSIGGPIENISGGHSYQFFIISNMDGVGILDIRDIYAEAQVRIGTFSGSSFPSSVNFEKLHLSIGDFATGVVPVAYIESTGRSVSFSFKNPIFNGNSRIVPLIHGAANVTINGGSFNTATLLGSFNNAGLQAAVNFTGGMLVGSAQTYPVSPAGKLLWTSPTSATYMTSPTAYSFQLMGPNADFSDFPNRAPFTQATTGFVDVQGQQWTFATGISGVATSGQLSGLSLSACDGTASGGVLTANYVQAAQEQLGPAYRINLGDIIDQASDGTKYVVTSVGVLGGGQYPITALQQNNMTLNGSSQCVTSNAAALTGVFNIIHTGGGLTATPLSPGGIVIPQQVYYCDFTATSTAVANCGGEQSFTNAPVSVAAAMDTYVKNGDHIWTYRLYNDPSQRWPYALGIPSVTALSGVTNGTPGSLTLSLAANLTGRFPVLPLPVR